MWDGFNKRKFPRINLHCDVEIILKGEKVLIASQTENVGIGGVCVILDQFLERFSECQVHVKIPQTAGIHCAAKIVWVVPTHNSDRGAHLYDTGLEFINLEAQQQDLLREILENAHLKRITPSGSL